jgi:hypothetical protein
MDRSEFAARNRDYVSDYIKFADAKAGAILAIGLAVSGLLGSLTDKIANLMTDASRPTMIVAVLVALVVVASTAMLVHNIVVALSPRTTASAKSLASFPDIAADPNWYLEQCQALVADNIAVHFEQHVAQLASIASVKFTHIRNAVFWLQCQILCAYALVVFYVVMGIDR